MAPVLRSHTRNAREEPTSPSIFPFCRLPLEMQLHVLRYSLAEDDPIVNFGALLPKARDLAEEEPIIDYGDMLPISRETMTESSDKRELGHNHASMAILSTCRMFYNEGWRYLVQNNHFVYTVEAGTRDIPPVPRAWDLKPAKFNTLTSMTLKQEHSFYHGLAMQTVFVPFECMEHMPALRNLSIEFRDFNLEELDVTDPFRNRKTIKQVRLFLQKYGYLRRNETGGLAFGSCLDELKITGIHRDDLGYFTVWMTSWLLKPGRHMQLHMMPDLMDFTTPLLIPGGVNSKQECIEVKDVESWVKKGVRRQLDPRWKYFILDRIVKGP